MNLDKAATETNRGAACSHGRLCDVSQIITLPNDHPHNAQEATLLTRTINGNGGAKPALGRSCEEYPFASTTQGGQNINSRCIPFYEQHMQKKILAGVRYAVEDLATCLVPEGSNKAVIIARAKQVDINLILEGQTPSSKQNF
ncbi:hypothetical protein CONCODRAFT_73860 [Conidiobolus coronatus NRRL 28638]|uniref:Deoxyribonuclease NucA/NucB domain-containing protein n=1 Tax=Conidiobolus coronatus (strain ATCC 28846 / CBS 209.66 / NRRL 28638) TaxID=796925 RepID=A0A137NTL0_CONC2|nr:hypothetical protein CONCODRAFT_73860 [Conidiobolus coronatus NRRL 28638]|eukprot:KXN66145.1 hypothetical protein CONCODRAFT_73860 [Conidiobolus coronatus NRRL 28638]